MKEIYSALPGVFHQNGKVKEEGLRGVIRHNIDYCQVDGLYVCGSTGENFLITTEAKKQILKITADEAAGKVKLIAHVGSNVFEEVAQLCDLAAELGYDAVSAVTPFYYKLSSEEIKAHYRRIAEYAKLPLVIYNIPLLTGSQLTKQDFSDMLAHPNISGVKYTSNDLYMLERLIHGCPDKKFFSGFDEMLLSYSVLPIQGSIGSTFNLMGRWARRLFALVDAGKLQEAARVQARMNDVIEKLLKAGLYQTMKEVLCLYNIDCSGCKPPFGATTAMQKETAQEVFQILQDADKGAYGQESAI